MIQIDGFVDVAYVAQGGFGSVFAAVRSSTGGRVAMKLLDRVPGATDDETERRLRREVEALVKLRGHPNVVHIEEVIGTERGPIVVMEYMDAGSAADLVDQTPSGLPLDRAVSVIRAAAEALRAAHAVDIIHRDVKPQNLLLNSYGQIKLCDFGISALLQPGQQRDRTTAISPRYASPEELDGDPLIGPPSDVYSLGATLHHLLLGAPPSFSGRTASATGTVRRPPSEAAHAAELLDLVDRCISVSPDHRPTIDEVIRTLAGDPSPPPPSSEPPSAPPDDRTVVRPGPGSAPPDDRTVVRPARREPSPSSLPAPTPKGVQWWA